MFFNNRKNLVITCAGLESLHNNFLDEYRQYDIAVINYTKEKLKFSNKVDYYQQKEGFKFNLIYHFLKNDWSKFFKKYNYFWFPDDDILTDTGSVNSLFEYMDKLNLDLAQPALTKDSYFSHPQVLVNKNKVLRKTNFVEIMCPCFSNKALKSLLETFNQSKSGWGLDFIWPKILEYNNVGIIDYIPVTHTKPCGVGDFYDNLKINNIDHEAERNTLIKSYNIPFPPIIHEFETLDKKTDKQFNLFFNKNLYKKKVKLKKRMRANCSIPRLIGGRVLDINRLAKESRVNDNS